MPRIRRGGKRIRGSNGGRTRNEDCCCEEQETFSFDCGGDTYVFPVTFIVTVTGMAGDLCDPGLCSAFNDTYTFTYFSTSTTGGGNVLLEYRAPDTTLCEGNVQHRLFVWLCDSGFPGEVRFRHRFFGAGGLTAMDGYFPDTTDFTTFNGDLTTDVGVGSMCMDGTPNVNVVAA